VPQDAADADPANANPIEPVTKNKAAVLIRMKMLLLVRCPMEMFSGNTMDARCSIFCARIDLT
jgi:hypothetical protein